MGSRVVNNTSARTKTLIVLLLVALPCITLAWGVRREKVEGAESCDVSDGDRTAVLSAQLRSNVKAVDAVGDLLLLQSRILHGATTPAEMVPGQAETVTISSGTLLILASQTTSTRL